MQNDPHIHAHPHHTGETSPLPPSSPSLSTTFRHHPQPGATTPTTEGPDQSSTAGPSSSSSCSTLRHRTPYIQSQHNNSTGTNGMDTIRVSVQTPFGDSGHRSRRKEGYPLSRSITVQQLKDDLVGGKLEGAGFWEKEGMRMVYQGRIVRDHETLGDIVGKTTDPDHVYVFHLVARRIPMTPMPMSPLHHPATTFPSTPNVPPITQLESAPQPTLSHVGGSVNSLALTDTIHYLLFTSRHHLFRLLNLDPLRWDDMVPPPVISQEKAREAVMSVVKTFAAQTDHAEVGREQWEHAFEGDDEASVKVVWEKRGRDGVEREIRATWRSVTGRPMADHGEETVHVEVDGITYSLSLPAPQDMTPSQLTHLLIYLRITALIPHLNLLLHQSLLLQTLPSPPPANTASQQPFPAPTPTTTIAPPGTRVVFRRTFRLRIPAISLTVLSNVFFSLIKNIMMIWMLTRNMRWDDYRFWVISGFAGGWWAVEVYGQLNRQAREVRARARAAAAAAAAGGAGDGTNHGGNAGQGQAQDNGNGQTPPVVINQDQPQANVAANNGNAPRPTPPRPRRNTTTTLASLIPRIHLATDSAELRLPPPSLNSPTSFSRPTQIRDRPMWVVTQLLLPIALWFVTLIPEWEAIRARAIRRRERSMRVLVNEMQPPQPPEQGEDRPGRVEDDTATPADQGLRRTFRLPDGMSECAKKYYLRVMERGEGIDWEEEREAQRAMGIEDEAEDGDGMRLRML
ncbi:hypothetical protein I316_01674 [Kwoniella heveanensis BCC8398]|uniref:Ubiquitin-like domain-containing protein n=1 Tax=Kwoniella heveanensis BCC8398 TaxID=1296120 RepID=A0A1B9GZJ2_9TREE|nr:hypothetical protein I316_01674 [Kwoniella heveanensis BCC8398]